MQKVYFFIYIFQFGSSVVCTLIHRGEILYNQMSPLDIDNQLQTEWYVNFTYFFKPIILIGHFL
jgi:hypothetical protein